MRASRFAMRKTDGNRVVASTWRGTVVGGRDGMRVLIVDDDRDFGDVLATARGVFGGVVLDFGADEITLLGVNASQLQADDFLI